MKTFFKTLWTAMLLFIGVSASAAITSGYYRIKSNYYDGRYITENLGDHTLITSALADNNYAQVWYISVNNSTVTIKNAVSDRYVQRLDTKSTQYSTATSSANFTMSQPGNVYTFADLNNCGLHCAATQSYNVVRWDTSADASKWLVESVTVNNSELAAQKAKLIEATTSQLTTFFTSTACTALNSTYASYTDANLRSAMSSLPTSVQDLAIKVKNNTWATYNGWNKTERTFRIADYKAYSDHDRWKTIFGFTNYTMGRLSNPTGIWANAGDYLQVYVGDIPNGQSVKLEVVGYGSAAGDLYTLHKGMNALQIASAGNCFVFYEVDNTTNGGTPYKLMSNYADVTVHIEGGTVQGYFDLTKGDTDSDWAQMKTHLLTESQVCLKTDKHVFNLNLSRLNTSLGSESLTEMLNVWRDVAQWQDELMGRSDEYGGQTTYGQYCNTMFTVTMTTDGYAYATSYGTYYPEYYDTKIWNKNALMTVADNMWCIAHEQGHSRQSPINMAGNTEISNNFFSNVAIYKQGRYTSRTASIQEVLRDFTDGLSWPERVAKACDSYGNYNQQILRLNWQLYLYFHVLGKDPDFFPRLFDALRADPLVKVKSGSADNSTLTPADTDYLKYYKKCCDVSGYDLTDFFAAYGFFILPTERDYSITYNGVTTNRFATLNDYGYYYLYATQSMIDAAKSYVAAKNYPKCNIIFIEDRVTAPDATYEGATAGTKKTINPDAPVTAFGQVGEMGQYTDFSNNENVTPAACSYNVSERGNVTIVGGEGAVGFIVYDASGNPIAFANTRTFTLPAGATNYTIKAAAADGTATVSATYNSSIAINEFPKTNKWYTFLSKGQSGRYTQSNGTGSGLTGTTGSTGNAKQWRFELRNGESETFDIINREDGSYISPLADGNSQVSTSITQPTSGWKIEAVGDYYIIFSGSTQLNQTAHAGYPIYNWGGGNNTTDSNCLFTISPIAEYDGVLPDDFDIKIAATPTDNISTGTWYVMYNRGDYRNYLYENSYNQLYNTNSNGHPGLVSSDAKRFLIRLSDAGNGKYYVETGRGNYVQALSTTNGTVATTGSTKEAFTIAKINSTDGHFYVQGPNNIILDCSAAYPNDAAVVSWGTSAPTSTGGNNDWAFYPVTLVPHFAPTSIDIFTINNTNTSRGALMYAPSQSEKWVWDSGKNNQTFDATNANCQWIFVPTETANQYYLYNVGKQKFVVPTKSGSWSNNNYTWMFSSDAVPVQLFLQSDGTYKINTVTGSIYLSVSNSYTGPIINYNDAGSEFTITKQGYASNAVSTQLATAIAAKPGATKTMALNAVGGKSYATLYLDYDAQTDVDTKAYYIIEASGGYTQLTPVDNEGRNIPAYTAVVLIKENGTVNPTFNTGFSVSNGYTEAVAENTNLLKGTLVSMSLDLGETTPYYSLGNNNGIGFYKFNDGTTSIITLGANKAYLEAGASSSKGFIFTFDDATAIAPIVNGQSSMVNDNWYTLDGRKLSGKPTVPGIYINNGKKIMIR